MKQTEQKHTQPPHTSTHNHHRPFFFLCFSFLPGSHLSCELPKSIFDNTQVSALFQTCLGSLVVPPRISRAFHSEPFRQTSSATRLALDRLPLDRPPPDYPRFRVFFPLPPQMSFFLLSLGGFLVDLWPQVAGHTSTSKPSERERQDRMTFAEGKGKNANLLASTRNFWASHPRDLPPFGPQLFLGSVECPRWSGGAGGVQNCGAGLCGGYVFFVPSVCLFLCRVRVFFPVAFSVRSMGPCAQCRGRALNAGPSAGQYARMQGSAPECRAVRSMQDRWLKAGQYARMQGRTLHAGPSA